MEFKLNEEQQEIKRAVREFCEKEFTPELALEYDQKEEFPMALYKKAARLGFTSMRIPTEYGGQGYGVLEECIVVEEMCRADPGLGVAVSLGNLMVPDVLLRHGSEEQKEKYIPPLARGDKIAAAAFTEPEHGSDITRMDTTAVKHGNEWVINGDKQFITNAPIADTFIILCQTDPNATPSHRGQSLFLAEKGMPGLEATKLHGKMGIKPCVTGSLSLSDLKVPETNLVGELNKGFYYALELFDGTRITVAAQAVGMAQGAFERALNYAKSRKQFGQPLINFQGVSFKLAEMAMKIEAARLMTYKAAWLYDKEKPNPMATSMAKAYASRVAMEVTDEAIQIFGGYGYLADYHVERFHRCAKITEIYEGTSEIQKLTIINFLQKQA
ncbi:MAG: acyl-CoA dehydrogenase family protein [Candidatus Bathyarchaeota archaeon]|jgi:alkylation response protein AidB-like acyl-CoA dehydrogenase|nr:acyl-CoA dehydrogenase family protein [Candidatus Bathyarchaeota archaeon]